MAPEQTGRNARLLDRRADFCSLGATLYASVTGQPPFGSDDPLQIIHDHIARIPKALAALDSRVPKNLSRTTVTRPATTASRPSQQPFMNARDHVAALAIPHADSSAW